MITSFHGLLHWPEESYICRSFSFMEMKFRNFFLHFKLLQGVVKNGHFFLNFSRDFCIYKK